MNSPLRPKSTQDVPTRLDQISLREVHPSEEAVEVLAAAGAFGRAADISLFSVPLR